MKVTTNLKALLTKAAIAGLVAGAAFMAAPQQANAQVAVGLRFGHARVGVYAPGPVYAEPYRYYAPPPVYVAPPVYGYYGGRYYERRWNGRRIYR